MLWCTSSGLAFFPECSPSANALNKKFFCLFLNLKEVRTGKAQPLVENTLCSVNPPTDGVDDKLMAGWEQRDEWFIVDDDNIRIAKACFTESKDDVFLGIEWIPRNLCSSSSANDSNVLVHPPSSQKSSEHSCLLALGLFCECRLDIWRQSLNGLMILRPDVKDHFMEYGTRIPAPIP